MAKEKKYPCYMCEGDGLMIEKGCRGLLFGEEEKNKWIKELMKRHGWTKKEVLKQLEIEDSLHQCMYCKGEGYVDWITNVVENGHCC